MKLTLRFFRLFFFIFLLNSISNLAMAIEEPKYETLKSEKPFEVRKYASYLIAETSVQADMDRASNQGFRRIADFIFGNNQAVGASGPAGSNLPAEPKEKLSAKIAMTAPVVVEPLDAIDKPMLSSDNWRIFFVMPSEYTEATLPKPNNPDVKIRAVPEKYYAVFNYSGFNGADKIQDYSNQLLAWVERNNLKPMGAPKLARYNPPWTLPMFRRNEIMIEVEQK